MKISFNLLSTGLANNGGSKTIIRSANTLQKLGADVTIVDSGANRNTWDKIECNYMIIKNGKHLEQFPVGDAVIATGYKSVSSTLALSPICGKKFHYIRLFESYIYTGDQMTKIMKAPTTKIVNSICLQRKLLEYNESSVIIRPGYDFNEIYPMDIRKNNKNIVIGGLYNEGEKRANKRTEWILETFNHLKKKRYPVELYMFGTDGSPRYQSNLYIKNPTIEEKNKLFNVVDIWLSPSCLDGLHIAPAEAMLTECCVCGNNSDQSGTEDYLVHGETGLVSENNLGSFMITAERLAADKEMRLELGKAGRIKVMSLGSREDNMKKMMDILK